MVIYVCYQALFIISGMAVLTSGYNSAAVFILLHDFDPSCNRSQHTHKYGVGRLRRMLLAWNNMYFSKRECVTERHQRKCVYSVHLSRHGQTSPRTVLVP